MSASLPSARQHPSYGDCLEVKSVSSVCQHSDVEQIGLELSLEVGSVISGVRVGYCVYMYQDKKKNRVISCKIGLDRFTL